MVTSKDQFSFLRSKTAFFYDELSVDSHSARKLGKTSAVDIFLKCFSYVQKILLTSNVPPSRSLVSTNLLLRFLHLTLTSGWQNADHYPTC